MLLFTRNATWVWAARLIILICVAPLAGRAASMPRLASHSLTGHVRDKADKPLVGVVITLQGVTATTTTNSSGDFFLTYTDEVPVLVLHYAGYQTQKLRVRAKSPVGITLYEVGTPLLPQAEGVDMVIETLEMPDVDPMFPGGAPAYQAYMRQNMHYPKAAQVKELTGTVTVSFTVDEQGRILDPAVAKGIDGLNEEALRLVSLMPWWTPARKNNKPVRSSSYLRIRFVYLEK